MPNRNGPVKIRQGNIDDLIAIYKRAYRRIVNEILTATDSGRIQRAQVMARINYELTRLGVDVNDWVKREIPQYYLDGANRAIQDLTAQGVDVKSANGFAVINREAIRALTDETALSFAEGITAISRNARRILDDAFKRQLNFIIAEGRLMGEARKTISREVAARLRQEGFTSLVDRGGKRWEFETYSRMLVRTKAVEARNQGLANRMLGYGFDLVEVSNHNTSHRECAKWEGKILSLTGMTKTGTRLAGGYVVAGTLEEAKLQGLFHPNCKHAINTLIPELAAKTKAYDNPYNYLSPADRDAADAAFRNRNRKA